MLIEGIEILNTGEKVLSYSWGWNLKGTICLIIGAVLFIFLIITLCFGIGDEEMSKYLFFIGFFLFLIGLFTNIHQNPTSIPTYEVIIDDNVSINDLTKKYEILNQRGRIYTIIERQENK